MSPLNEHIEILLNATTSVASNYFQLPMAGQEKRKYRERCYCYELYHQMRQQMGNASVYSLAGEIDKGDQVIYKDTYLNYKKPDFLFHECGVMVNNLLVVEVKS